MPAEVCDISVVIPSLNEAANLYRLLPKLKEALDNLHIAWEIIVVDGDSTDGTPAVVENAGARYINETRRGYGTAILRGVTEARGEFVLTMDADMSHPAEFVQQLWSARTEADIVIGSRYVPGGHADQPWFRAMLSRILNGFFGYGLAMPVKDMSSGFRLYRRSVFRNIDLTFTNFVILIEILLKAFARGARIKEAPFHYKPRQSGNSHARIIKFGVDYLRLFHRMWRIRNSVDFPDYDERAFDSRIPLQKYWQRKRYDIIMRFTPKFVSTVDVGCGSSHILADLPHAIGVDMRHEKLSYMRKSNKLLLQANGLQLPFPDDSFDCAISSEVIEHIPEENGKLIDELTRVLKPGGTLVLGTPDYGGWQWPLIEKAYALAAPSAYADEHVTHYTYDSLRKALLERGYEITAHDYICKAELIFQATKPGKSAPSSNEI
ncbi:MAG: glycosyltransferase [Candidatus Hydrogenedentes bacterium]|nr:glycosyltransferase [Candidatus Hydrogenedentota bacterium]